MLEPMTESDPPPNPGPAGLESTATLLDRARQGDSAAREELFSRVLPALTRWAHRRLPFSARDLADTDDLVQTSLARSLHRLDGFECRGEGAFLAYLRQILLNLVRSEIERAQRRVPPVPLPEMLPDPAPTLLERTVRREILASYEVALAELPDEQREAVLLRLEFDYSHQQVADALGKPSADAARMMIGRALLQIARRMDVD
jgi:RNA polymerase sigma-70 factor (ECF subfamily)